MATFIRLMTLMSLVSLAGCSTVSSMPRPDYAAAARASQEGSLFPGDAATMDDKAVANALTFRVSVPARIRLAVLELPDRGTMTDWIYWQSDREAQGDVYPDFIAALRASPRLYDAAYLPGLMVPDKRTLPYLREAAARFQADMLFVFQTRCDMATDIKLFTPDEVRADCLVQAVVLDTRSGVVPFTSVATESVDAKKGDADTNFSVTVRNAKNAAVQKALLSIAHDTLRFLQTLPQSSDTPAK